MSLILLSRLSVLFPHSQEDQPEARGCPLLLRQQRDPANLRHHGQPLPGAPRGGLLPLHRLLGRERLRTIDAVLRLCLSSSRTSKKLKNLLN